MDIILENICKSYDGKIVLNNFNGIIKKNEINYIRGKSGAGKTTLINIIMGLESQDQGQVLGLEGRLGVVFQEDRLCEDLDALGNVRLVADRATGDGEIVRVLEDLELGDSIYKKASSLSGGMRRRLALARGLIIDPDILILDEAFKGLDKELSLRVFNYVKEKLRGKTLIIVSHDESNSLDPGQSLYLP